MPDTVDTFVTQLKQRFEGLSNDCFMSHGMVTLEINSNNLLNVCKALRDEEEFSFEQLSDLCGVDYATYGQADWETKDSSSTGFSRGVSQGVFKEEQIENKTRFAVVYHLLSLKHNRRLRLRCLLTGEPPRIDSVISIWASADWYEREAFDLFGILFDGHPDLRRILTDYGFIGHPFRKDFPLEGNVEVRYDPDKQRVVYQPVTIENRVLVPRVIRDDSRDGNGESEGKATDA
jgi:NADH-quinone oxidoreductase subunit C